MLLVTGTGQPSAVLTCGCNMPRKSLISKYSAQGVQAAAFGDGHHRIRFSAAAGLQRTCAVGSGDDGDRVYAWQRLLDFFITRRLHYS